MANSWHVSWLKEGVIPWNYRRRKISFEPDLSGLDFSEILPEDFRKNPKSSRYFVNINLSNADMSGADLSYLNFRKANFSQSDLSEANLDGSNFEFARFRDTNLRFASAQRADVTNTTFIKANLEGAILMGSNAESAEIIESGISEIQINSLENSRHAVVSASLYEYRLQKRLDKAIGEGAPASGLAKEKEKIPKYDVYYGTNREPIHVLGKLTDFGDTPADKLSYGICEVLVPKSHKIGSLGSPVWKRVIKRVDDRLKIDHLISLNQSLFWSHFKATAQRMKVQERPTVFVHGFNHTFSDAVLRAAQIGYDLGIGQGMGLFSWPSKGGLLDYLADGASADSSKYLLADFIEEFVQNSDAHSVNIIAHSMSPVIFP